MRAADGARVDPGEWMAHEVVGLDIRARIWVDFQSLPGSREAEAEGILIIRKGRLYIRKGRLYIRKGRLYIRKARLYIRKGRLLTRLGLVELHTVDQLNDLASQKSTCWI